MTAFDKISRARTQLLFGQPFWASLVLRLKIEPFPKDFFAGQYAIFPKTMATDGSTIFYDEDFVNGLKLKHLETILAHECAHCFLMHVTRRGSRNPIGWNLACVAEDTMILMADGSLKPIGEIHDGEFVASPFGPNMVIKALDNGIKETMELDVDICGKLVCTPEHKIFTSEGFVNAETIGESVQGWVCEGSSWSNRLHSSQLPNHDHAGDVGGDESLLPFRLEFPLHQEAQSEAGKNAPQERESLTNRELESGAMCVPSRNHRRGRDHNGSGPREVLSPAGYRNQHLLQTEAVPGEPGIFDQHLPKQLQSPLFQAFHFWLSDQRTTAKTSTASDNQENERRITLALHRHAASTGISLQSNARNVADMAADSGAKHARISVRERNAGARRVLDLTTEYHTYYANGVLVHNCDQVTNLLLKECGFEIPPRCEPDDKYKNMTAEQAYALMAKQQQQQQSGGKGKGDGQGKGQPQWSFGEGSVGQMLDSEMSEAEKSQQEHEWQNAAEQAAKTAKAAGNLPGSLERLVTEVRAPKVDWITQLRRFMENTVPKDYVWFPPNRRYVASGVYLPSVLKRNLGVIVVAIDTSGSVSQEQLKAFCSELNHIVNQTNPDQVHVIYCDTHVQRMDTFQGGEEVELSPRGGGGTMFSPVFKHVKKEGLNPRCLIYCTDLEASDFGPEPEYPTLWLTDSTHIAPWGETLQLIIED